MYAPPAPTRRRNKKEVEESAPEAPPAEDGDSCPPPPPPPPPKGDADADSCPPPPIPPPPSGGGDDADDEWDAPEEDDDDEDGDCCPPPPPPPPPPPGFDNRDLLNEEDELPLPADVDRSQVAKIVISCKKVSLKKSSDGCATSGLTCLRTNCMMKAVKGEDMKQDDGYVVVGILNDGSNNWGLLIDVFCEDNTIFGTAKCDMKKLMQNPEKMKKIKAHLKSVGGKNRGEIEMNCVYAANELRMGHVEMVTEGDRHSDATEFSD